jgi:hypothetical protein
VERLDRDEDRPRSQAEARVAALLSWMGHTASVGTYRSHAAEVVWA